MKRSGIAAMSVVMMVLVVSSPALATTVSLVPDNPSYLPGSTVNVSVVMNESPGLTMTAMSEIIFFDPAVFTYVDESVVQGALLTPTWDFLAGVPNPGELRVASFSGGTALAGDGTLFTFSLNVAPDAAVGTYPLTWGDGSFLGNGFGYGDADFVDVLVPSSNGSINVVPEPGTIVLLGMGLIGLLAYAWRRRRS